MDTTQDPVLQEPGTQRGRRTTARVRVYEALRGELLSTAVSPFARYTEENVAERFGVSRTPVRDALARLEADGLLVKRDGGLFRYTPTVTEFTDLYELRVLLETCGLDRAIDDPTIRHDAGAIEAELTVWQERADSGIQPDAGFVTADEQFHTVLLGAAGNAELVGALQRVNRRIRPVRMHDYLTQDRVDATISEHIAIGELVLSGRLREARDSLRTHVGQSQSIVRARAARAMHLMQLAP
ncbi:GntR family transcriptional regulator [Promicromonospora sp. NPDC050880]|uniref:GntR family transcriptional regulator n=1 Tax=unclassified Promicromonospora TaxID=2647929 RepID=UPI003798E4F5